MRPRNEKEKEHCRNGAEAWSRQRLEPTNKRQPTTNKQESEERKKEWVRSANNDNGETKEKQNEANKAQSGEKNNNQSDRNGGDLPCDGRQPLKAAAGPPNPPPSIFEVAEVVKN